MQAPEEKRLIEKLNKSNKKAFDRLYREYEKPLYAFAYKLTRSHEEAEEIVQDAFLKIWEKRFSVDKNKSFKAFLFTIARNKIYNKARRRTYEHAYENYLKYQHTLKQKNSTEETFQYRETWHAVKGAIEELPAKRKEVFTLSRVNGMSNKEIANLTDTSVSNIENHINKALRFLKMHLSNRGIISITLFVYWVV